MAAARKKSSTKSHTVRGETYQLDPGISPDLGRFEGAIDAIVSGFTITSAAEMSGLSRETLSRAINHNPYVKAKLNQRRIEMRSELLDKIGDAITRLVDAITGGFEDSETNPNVKLQAACNLLPKLLPVVMERSHGSTDALFIAKKMTGLDWDLFANAAELGSEENATRLLAISARELEEGAA